MIVLYFSSFVLKYYTILYVAVEKKNLDDPRFWSRVQGLRGSDTTGQVEIFQVFYWLNDGNLSTNNFK